MSHGVLCYWAPKTVFGPFLGPLRPRAGPPRKSETDNFSNETKLCIFAKFYASEGIFTSKKGRKSLKGSNFVKKTLKMTWIQKRAWGDREIFSKFVSFALTLFVIV